MNTPKNLSPGCPRCREVLASPDQECSRHGSQRATARS